MPATLLHVSLRAARESILQRGIDNRHADHSPWSNVDDYDDGAYLWDNETDAREYADWLRERGVVVDLWRVDAAQVTVTADVTGATPTPGAWHAAAGVPADAVELIGLDPSSAA